MECAPTAEEIQNFASQHPDRYITAMANLGKLGGFTEKQEIDHNININIRSMSDSQLEDKFNELKQRLIDSDNASEVVAYEEIPDAVPQDEER